MSVLLEIDFVFLQCREPSVPPKQGNQLAPDLHNRERLTRANAAPLRQRLGQKDIEIGHVVGDAYLYQDTIAAHDHNTDTQLTLSRAAICSKLLVQLFVTRKR